jgi:hypothetical protein
MPGTSLNAPIRARRGRGHPYFAAAPCTRLIDEVEGLWAPIAAADDRSPFAAKLAGVARMAGACGTASTSASA